MGDPDPQPADFILVHMKGLGGRLIQALEFLDGTGFDDYEHVALYIGNGVVIQMLNRGISVGKVSDYDDVPHRWSSGRIDLNADERFNIVTAGRKYLSQNIGYSWADYGALVLRHFRIPAPHLRRYIESTGHMICSQLIAACYRDGGHPLYSYWTGYVTPGDLNQLLGPE